MPRIQREKGEFLSCHIVQRGNDRKNIFLQDEDRLKFLRDFDKSQGEI